MGERFSDSIVMLHAAAAASAAFRCLSAKPRAGFGGFRRGTENTLGRTDLQAFGLTI